MTGRTPEWAKHAIWYQIFPERFWNGDPGNDPTLESQRNAWPHDLSLPWHVHPWSADWYALADYERANGRGIWHNLQRRRYGGDLQGVLDRLDYLAALGVNALYLNPVFHAPSSHKYDGASYHHVDPTFGPDPLGDLRLMQAEVPGDSRTWVWTAADKLLLTLIERLHARGMRLILDGVFNHMGLNSWAFQHVRAHGLDSPYADWFKIRGQAANVFAPFSYTGWYGVPELPELRQDERGIVAGPKAYIFEATRRWMDPDGDGDPADGIDGWRLDVAFCVRHGFWKDWRAHVRAINPEAYLTAEIIDTPEANAPYLEGDEFDAVMNYNFGFAASEFFIERSIGLGALDAKLAHLRTSYRAEVAYVMQNLYGSHDTDRVASRLVNAGFHPFRDWTHYHPKAQAENNAAYQVRKPHAAERETLKLMTAFQMTSLGAPMIYYGDEAGMWGANDPCCRKPMVWPDLVYVPEQALPHGGERTPDEVVFDHDLHAHYQRWIQLRRRLPALRAGDLVTELVDDRRGLWAFTRSLNGQTVRVVLNASGQDQAIDWVDPAGWVDAHTGAGGVHGVAARSVAVMAKA